MNIRNLFLIWAGTAMFVAFTSNASEKAPRESDDPVVASFERELNHEPVDTKRILREDIDDDILYERISLLLRSSDDEAPTDEAAPEGEE